MKTLFLDFDGVLHCMAQTASRPFDRLELIEPLVDVAPFEIVISSSWRFHMEVTEIRSRLGRLEPLVVGTTGEAMVGRYARHQEILEYVQCYQLTEWRILDDSFLEFPENTDELIRCNPRTGVGLQEVGALRAWLLR